MKKLESVSACMLALSSVLGASDAGAQLLLGKGKAARAIDTTVVVQREGDQTVLTLSAKVEGGSDEVAWILPVSAALDLRSLESSSVAPLERVTRPRFVELWEQDPCEPHGAIPPLVPAPDPSTEPSLPAPGAAPTGELADAGFRVDLLGGSSAAIFSEVEKRGFPISDAARAVLAGDLDSGGTKLLLARLPLSELGDDRLLPPLRVHSSSTGMVLPTRLFATSGPGAELRVHVIAPHRRFEAAGQPNLAVPTNLDVDPQVRASERAFYDRLIAHSFEQRPGAVLTEYVWRASTCEGCEAPLAPRELDELGLALLPSAKSGRRGEVIVHADEVSDDPGGPARLRDVLTACYVAAQLESPGIGGVVSVAVDIEDEKLRLVASGSPAPAALERCVELGAESSDFDKSGALRVEFVPVSRGYFGSLVLTTLRARYDSLPDEDLVLRPARAIEGGREIGPDNRPEQRVYWADEANNFQARYVVRHAFQGAVDCATPQRGVWWARPPAGWKEPSPTGAAPNDEPRRVSLASLVRGELPPVDAYAIAYEAAPPLPPEEPLPELEPSPSASPSDLPSKSPTPRVAPRGTSWKAVGLGLAALLGLGALALRARRQTRTTPAERVSDDEAPPDDPAPSDDEAPPDDPAPPDDEPGDQPPR